MIDVEDAESERLAAVGDTPVTLSVELGRLTLPYEELAKLRPGEVLRTVAAELGAREVIGNEKIAKVSIVGVGMRSHAGVATKMFEALSNEGINIQMISTSEIKISVVIEEKYLELAVRSLHSAFELDKPSVEEEVLRSRPVPVVPSPDKELNR